MNESYIILAGIQGNGVLLAEELKGVIEEISDIKVHLCQVYIDKKTQEI